MRVMIKGQWVGPFWGATDRYIKGQDHLGLQNASIATYGVLLPGMTNLTKRLRYYGFYTWLIEMYAQHVHKDSTTEFRRFVRRGELLYAFVMMESNPNEHGIVGSQFAKRVLRESSGRLIDIAAGADPDAKVKYFNHSAGAFGQYYQAVLVSLGLIGPRKDNRWILVCTPQKGRDLAKSYDVTLSEQKKNEFLMAVQKGKIERARLVDLLEDFSPNATKRGSDEWHFYRRLLLDADIPDAGDAESTTFRKQNIALYLEFLKSRKKAIRPRQFADDVYYHRWASSLLSNCSTLDGWYYYQLNEYCQYLAGILLWGILIELQQQGRVHYPVFIRKLADAILHTAKRQKDTNGVSAADPVTRIIARVQRADYRDINSSYLERIVVAEEHVTAMARAISLLLALYAKEQSRLHDLLVLAKRYNMWREGDSIGVLNWVHKHEADTFKTFTERLLAEGVIHRHIEEAFRKLRASKQNSLKFQIEDGYVDLIEVVVPSWTSPRLETLHQFLVDMKCIDQKGKVTAIGEEMLKGAIQ
jgi:hypothetical protein